MKRSVRWTLLASVITALAMFVAACGSSSSSSSIEQQQQVVRHAGQGRRCTQGKKGGKLTYLAASDVDYLDPGQTYYTFGFMVQNAVNRALYSFKPDNSVKPVPDLAEGEPQISADKQDHHGQDQARASSTPRRSTARSRPPTSSTRSSVPSRRTSPAATPVRTSVDRRRSQGRYAARIKPISGIKTPDDNTIVFKLKEPQAPLVSRRS